MESPPVHGGPPDAPPSSRAGALLADLPARRGFAAGVVVRASGRAPTYYATHDRTEAAPEQIVTTETQNILLRQFHALSEAKKERQKRASADAAGSDEPKPKRSANGKEKAVH